jgi:hypothetical protein
MLKLFSIPQCRFYKQQNFFSYTFIFRKQFYFVPSGLKIVRHGNTNNNLESPCVFFLIAPTALLITSTPSTKFFVRQKSDGIGTGRQEFDLQSDSRYVNFPSPLLHE